MYEASLSYDGMTDEESAKDLAERILDVFPSALTSTGMDMAFAQINVVHDGIWYKIEPYASRKKIVVPAMANILED